MTDTSPVALEPPASQSRARSTFVSSRLPALVAALLAAATFSAHAQSNWTGAVNSNWFLAENWLGGIPANTREAIINTVAPNPTVLATPNAQARSLQVGANATGTLTIQDFGTLIVFGAGSIGNLPGGLGTVTVTGADADLRFNGTVVVGGQGTGFLNIENGGTMSSAGGSVGQSAGSTGTVTVTGAGSTWTNGVSGGLNIGSFGTGTLIISDGGRVNNLTLDTIANIGSGASGQGTVIVTGAGSAWSNVFGLNIDNSGTGTLTIADGGLVSGLGGPIVIAAQPGSTGTLNIGAGAAPGILIPPTLAFGTGNGTLNFNHTSAAYVFATDVSGGGVVNVIAGTTIFTGENTYTGGTTILGSSGILQIGNGGTVGSITGDVLNNNLFIVNRSDVFTFGEVISGSGAFEQNGTGTTFSQARTPTPAGRRSRPGRCRSVMVEPAGRLSATSSTTASSPSTARILSPSVG